MQKEIESWLGGAFVHAHPRIDNLLNKVELEQNTAKYMDRYRDGGLSHAAITKYLENIFGRSFLITDTQHPSYVLSEDYDDLSDEQKIQFFNPLVVNSTVDLLSTCILERMRIIRSFQDLSHVMSGVEVDMLRPRGELTVHDDALSKLDYVTCSYHSSIWKAAGNSDPTKNQCIENYNFVVGNPNIDTISHPTLYLPKDAKRTMRVNDWNELFVHMSQREVAFEVSLDSTNLLFNSGNNLDCNLIVSAKEHGVPITIAFDFHYLQDWGIYPAKKGFTDVEDAEGAFNEQAENGSISKFLARIMGNIYALKELGFKRTDIINSDEEAFKAWSSKRTNSISL